MAKLTRKSSAFVWVNCKKYKFIWVNCQKCKFNKGDTACSYVAKSNTKLLAAIFGQFLKSTLWFIKIFIADSDHEWHNQQRQAWIGDLYQVLVDALRQYH